MSKQTQKGTHFETMICEYLSRATGGRITRRVKHGIKDEGDIEGVYIDGKELVIEAKDRRTMELPKWLAEAEIERGNADAEYAVVVHHRYGKGAHAMDEQYATMTLGTLADIICKGRANNEARAD